MKTYKLYTATERGDYFEEYYTKQELLKFKMEEDWELFECAEYMVSAFNRGEKDVTQKRYAYKLELLTIEVVGSNQFYGLNISAEMYQAELPKLYSRINI